MTFAYVVCLQVLHIDSSLFVNPSTKEWWWGLIYFVCFLINAAVGITKLWADTSLILGYL